MGFYGKVNHSDRVNFTFDKIYNSRKAMEDALKTNNESKKDKVAIGRYVLIEYGMDVNSYPRVYSKLDDKVKDDLDSYSRFFDEYRDSAAADVSGAINDSYLQANGQKDGIKSYGMIVDLTCAYLKSNK